MPGGCNASDRLSVKLNDEKTSANVTIRTAGTPVAEFSLDAAELDEALAVLGEARTSFRAPVTMETPNRPGGRELVVPDPAWRTNHPPHSAMDGIMLRLRHLGFGWLTFFLPRHEAKALGDWLTHNSEPREPPGSN